MQLGGSLLAPGLRCSHPLCPQLTAISGAVHVKREELAHKVLLRGAQQRLVLSHHKVAVLGQEVVGAVRHRACKRGGGGGGWGGVSAARLRAIHDNWGVTDQETRRPLAVALEQLLKQLLHDPA